MLISCLDEAAGKKVINLIQGHHLPCKEEHCLSLELISPSCHRQQVAHCAGEVPQESRRYNCMAAQRIAYVAAVQLPSGLGVLPSGMTSPGDFKIVRVREGFAEITDL